MKTLIASFVLSAVCLSGFGQTAGRKCVQPPDQIGIDTVGEARKKYTLELFERPSEIKKEEIPFIAVEQMPAFPGGRQKLEEFIRSRLRYPDDARAAGVEGIVLVRIVVDKTGRVIRPEVLQPLSRSCDGEAIRLAGQMPRWKPGCRDGNAVDVYTMFPVRFRLPGRGPADETPLAR